jgi:hypothetical protein
MAFFRPGSAGERLHIADPARMPAEPAFVLPREALAAFQRRSLPLAPATAPPRLPDPGARCRSTFHGSSPLAGLAPGALLRVQGHARPGYDGDYRIVDVAHAGDQRALLPSGMGEDGAAFYRNTFTAVPAAGPWRPEPLTPLPRIQGFLPARVVETGPALDALGRHRVRLPFPAHGRPEALAWVPMVQPTGGPGQGMAFPLPAGAEVLLAFLDGDPDRPVLAGALPTASQPPLVSQDNAGESILQAPGGGRLRFRAGEDAPGLDLSLPGGAGLAFRRPPAGNPGDPPPWDIDLLAPGNIVLGSGLDTTLAAQGRIAIASGQDATLGTGGSLTLQAARGRTEQIKGPAREEILGSREVFVEGARQDFTLGTRARLVAGADLAAWAGSRHRVGLGLETAFHAAPRLDCRLGGQLSLGWGDDFTFTRSGLRHACTWGAAAVSRASTLRPLAVITTLTGILSLAHWAAALMASRLEPGSSAEALERMGALVGLDALAAAIFQEQVGALRRSTPMALLQVGGGPRGRGEVLMGCRPLGVRNPEAWSEGTFAFEVRVMDDQLFLGHIVNQAGVPVGDSRLQILDNGTVTLGARTQLNLAQGDDPRTGRIVIREDTIQVGTRAGLRRLSMEGSTIQLG